MIVFFNMSRASLSVDLKIHFRVEFFRLHFSRIAQVIHRGADRRSFVVILGTRTVSAGEIVVRIAFAPFRTLQLESIQVSSLHRIADF